MGCLQVAVVVVAADSSCNRDSMAAAYRQVWAPLVVAVVGGLVGEVVAARVAGSCYPKDHHTAVVGVVDEVGDHHLVVHGCHILQVHLVPCQALLVAHYSFLVAQNC